jgi:hypothetical protein
VFHKKRINQWEGKGQTLDLHCPASRLQEKLLDCSIQVRPLEGLFIDWALNVLGRGKYALTEEEGWGRRGGRKD